MQKDMRLKSTCPLTYNMTKEKTRKNAVKEEKSAEKSEEESTPFIKILETPPQLRIWPQIASMAAYSLVIAMAKVLSLSLFPKTNSEEVQEWWVVLGITWAVMTASLSCFLFANEWSKQKKGSGLVGAAGAMGVSLAFYAAQ